MKRKLVKVFSMVLIIYGLITFLPGYIITGLVLLFLITKKYDPSTALNFFGIIYLLTGMLIFVYFGKNQQIMPYNISILVTGVIFLVINHLGDKGGGIKGSATIYDILKVCQESQE